jgi:3-oxoacyl-[acyl-carrier protein] reductase
MTSTSPVCAITGGTLGIGRHTAELLASDGWAVAICSRHGDQAALVAAEIAATYGRPAVGVGADVVSAREVGAFAEEVDRQLGPVSAVVANAAVLGPVGPLYGADLSSWAQAVAVDLVGVANTIAAFAPAMIERHAGSIIALAGGGVGGPSAVTRLSAYTSSKAGVMMLTETVAAELEPLGVRLNAISPGAIATRFMEPLLEAGPAVAGADLFAQVEDQRRQSASWAGYDALLRFLLDPAEVFISGRILSARWESPDRLRTDPPAAASSRYRIRRIDEDLYAEMSRGATQ